MTPDFKVIAAGVNITPQIRDRLLSLTVRDDAGARADTVEITLDDRGGLIELPAPGAPLLVMLGYRETGLVPMGLFTSDEVTVSAPPATLTIRAKAADLGGSIKDQKTRSWDKITIGDIVGTIAGEHDLKPKVADRFRAILIDISTRPMKVTSVFWIVSGATTMRWSVSRAAHFCSWGAAKVGPSLAFRSPRARCCKRIPSVGP